MYINMISWFLPSLDEIRTLDMTLQIVLRLIIFFVIAAILIIFVVKRNTVRYWVALLYERGVKITFHLDKCRKVLQELYKGVNATRISLDERDEKNIRADGAYVYGEVSFLSFASILEIAEPQPGEVFYDLGSGGGKAVFIAALVYDFGKTCGIEKLSGLYHLSMQLLEKLQNLPEFKKYFPNKQLHIQFIHDDIENQDIHDADIVFVNATCFEGRLWDSMVAKFAQLKTGARVIVGSKVLELGGYELTHSGLHLMSWGMHSVRIYKKI